METVNYLLNLYRNEIDWSKNTSVTPYSRQRFDEGMDTLLGYSGHPDTLLAGLRHFTNADSLPHGLAGAGEILSMASYRSGDSYETEGLEQAVAWVERAQQYVPDQPEINMIEADIYIKWHRFDDARLVLNQISKNTKPFYHLAMTELYYGKLTGNHEHVRDWGKRGWQLAQSDIHRLGVLRQIANFYLQKGMDADALRSYQRIVKIDGNDPWTWHNMSLIYMDAEDYDMAERCNKKALSIMLFGMAEHIGAQIRERKKAKQKQNKKGFLGKLFGD